MCGICGVWNFADQSPVNHEILVNMRDSLAHRGPDDEGILAQGSLGLGFRRLSIIDLEGGRQPMSNEDGTIWIVFNGEIYNFKDLRFRLEGLGHTFSTQSDSEVIVHAYEQYGPECPNYLDGMFGFAIWDGPRKRIFLARDRSGIKPLYYAICKGVFIFASELRGIIAHPMVPRDIDREALSHYLSFEYVPAPKTIFRGINKLEPGSSLIFQNGRGKLNHYWAPSLELSEGRLDTDLDNCAKELRQTLGRVVEKELVSDVPTGVLLSGGIDSSVIAALMSQFVPGELKSFSVSFQDRSFDESRHANLVATTLGATHHEIMLTSDKMLQITETIPDIIDEPFSDSSMVPTYFLSKYTSDHVKVALGGDGGDELFGGYSTLIAHRISEYYNRFIPGPIRTRLIPRLVDKLPVSFDNISLDFKARRFISGQDELPVIRHHIWLGSFTEQQKSLLFGPELRGYEAATRERIVRESNDCAAKDHINKILHCDRRLYLEGDILTKVDRASMSNGLEVRVPFLNREMLEFSDRIPWQYKIRRGITKYILRKSFKGYLPDSILKRGKKGFNMPVAKWLLGPLKPLAQDMLSEKRLNRHGYFDGHYVGHLLKEHLSGKRDNRKLLWTLIVFEMWRDRWTKP